jgi:16S rRNA (adenine1518-N6/adenine1519-N6)-dimethyltransferase
MSLDAKKSLGQNFLKSRKAINDMIRVSEISARDVVIEIGPGKGALTIPLLETGATVIAFELDERMIEFLKEKCAKAITRGQLVLVHQDVLEANVEKYTFGKPYKLVANIPYYITNLIIRNFLSGEYQPTLMCLLVQKEVAERIVSRDGKESILSLSVKFFGTPKYITKVARHYFSPIPKVDSAIILISDIHRNAIFDILYEEQFFTVIKKAFGQKRKQAIKNLTELSDKKIWLEIFEFLNINSKSRAEDISFNYWVQIVDLYFKKYSIDISGS